MRSGIWIGLGIGLVIALVIGGLALGWAWMARRLWAVGPIAAPGMVEGTTPPGGCDEWGYGMGPGMMGRGIPPIGPCIGWRYEGEPGATTPSGGLTIEEAHAAAEQYIARLGYPNLEVAEVMEFERNFYVIVRETDTGIGAMELLVDKWTGAVGPEMGPNMMWNGKYGMHGRSGWMMGGGARITNSLTAEEALQVAQRWLSVYRPGVTTEEHADPFYGYYTIHTLKDGEIEGMLSVHGTTGQVWYHTWHGSFIQMVEENRG